MYLKSSGKVIEKHKNITLEEIIIKLASVILLFIFISINIILNKGYSYLAIYSLFINILIIYKYRKIQPLFIIFIFMASYLIYPIIYFIFDTNISFYSEYQNIPVYSKVLQIHSVFILSIYIFTPYRLSRDSNRKEKISDYIKIEDNKLLFYFSILTFIICILLGKRGDSIISSGGYAKGNMVTSAIYEYGLLFYLIAYKYSGEKVLRNNILKGMYFTYVLRSLMFGGRIEIIQISIIFFILFLDNKTSYINVFYLILSGVLVINFIGVLRSDVSLSNKVSIQEILSMNTFNGMNGEYIESNQGEVFYASASYIGLIEDDIYDYKFRIKSLIGFIQNLFIPSKFTSPEGIVSTYTVRYTGIGGGGLISSYLFLWSGIIGVILGAYIICKILKQVFRSKSEVFYMYIVMIITTTPRWFAYSPNALIKLSGLIIILYYIYNLLNKILSKQLRIR